jgi:hypothetical protein
VKRAQKKKKKFDVLADANHKFYDAISHHSSSAAARIQWGVSVKAIYGFYLRHLGV